MAQYSPWRSVATSLPLSKRWRRTSNRGARLWLGILLASDSHGALDADPDQLLLTAVPGLDWSEDEVAAALIELEAAGLIQTYAAEGGRWAQVVDFDKHQPREWLRKRGARRTPEPPSNTPDEGRTTAPLEIEVEIEGEEGLPDGSLSVSPKAGLPDDDEPDTDSADARAVYDHWKAGQERTGGLVPRKLTDDRARKIRARLAEGYTVDQLCRAVDGFLADPFHLGQNSQQTRYTDLTTLFKNAAKVDAGIQLADRASATVTNIDDARSKYVRPVPT